MILLLIEGQVSDYRGAATVLPALPEAKVMIADRGYDSDWFHEALTDQGINPCAFRAARTARNPSSTTPNDTNNETESSACSAGSRTGAASQPDTTGAPTLS